MTYASRVNRDWKHIVARLGGATRLETGARETKAFLRARVVENAVDLLRMILAYCLGERGLRSTAAWASAVKKPPQAAEIARRKARREAAKGRRQISKGTLAAAEWVIIVTSLAPDAFTTDDVLALYRLRWRIELAFKRLKSLIGLKGPSGLDERSAKPYLLAHLLRILLLEPLVDAFEDSPRLQLAA